MPTARNMRQLNAMLTNQLRKAMKETKEAVLADMQEATDRFYAGGQPIRYERTGALGETPDTTPVVMTFNENGGSGSFEAYLDTSHQYTTGKRPSMKTVLNLANDWTSPPPPHHLRETAGEPEFWESAEKEMEKSFHTIIKENFC